MSSTAEVTPSTNPTLQERIAQGAAARERTPLARHADYAPAAGRDALSILEKQATSRLPELVPVRYGRMLVSPFTYYRGATAVMAADLAGTPTSGLVTQLCGDAHLLNFGLFASPERHLVFDVNDFDETFPGPWEWDVKRLAASLVVASRANGHARKEQRAVVRGAVERYRTTLQDLAGQGHLSAWYAHLDIDESAQRLLRPLTKPERKAVTAMVAKSRRHTNTQATQKLTTVEGGTRRFIAEPLLLEPVRSLAATGDGEALQRDVHEVFARYRRSVPSTSPCCSTLRRRRYRPQGRRRRQRRNPLLRRATTRPRRERLADPAGQRGTAVGPRVASRTGRLTHLPQAGPTSRRRPATHAGHQRHLPGLGHRPGHRW